MRSVVPVAAIALAVVPAAPAAAADPVPQAPRYGDAVTYRMNTAHTGASSGAALPNNLTRRWSRDLGGRLSYPLIIKGRVFVTVTSDQGPRLHALSAATGRVLWKTPPVGSMDDIAARVGKATLTYDGGRVITLSSEGRLSAFSASTGRRLWHRVLRPQWSFTAPPTARDGFVYVAGGGPGGRLWKIDIRTGETRWSLVEEDGGSLAVDASSVYGVTGVMDAYRYGVNGRRIWVHDKPGWGGSDASPVLDGDRVWLRDFSQTKAVSRTTGRVLEFRGPESTSGPMTQFAIGRDAIVMASDLARGTESSPWEATVSAVDRRTLRPLWSTQGDGLLATTPVISGNRVYAGSLRGNVFAWDLRTGRQVWHGKTGERLRNEVYYGQLSGVAIGGGKLVVPASEKLVAFG